jgi:superfamily II DNA or RNA helicase
MDPRFNQEVVGDFLESIGHRQASKGYKLFASGAVERITADPDKAYSYRATVRDGGESFAVELDYDDDAGWSGFCDCESDCDCRHCAAVLHAARRIPAPVSVRAAPPRQFQPVGVRQKSPPMLSSPLSIALERSLGRGLNDKETAYVLEIHKIMSSMADGVITKWHLSNIAVIPGPSWDRVELCPDQPANDLECWQYVARLLKKLRIGIPRFMEPVTDAASVDAILREWERRKEIEKWRTMVDAASQRRSIEADVPLKAELRLRFVRHHAEVEWRSGDSEQYRKCREKDVGAVVEALQSQSLSCSRETERLLFLLLSGTDPARSSYEYGMSAAVLRRIVDTPDLAALTVGPAGQPLKRSQEKIGMICETPAGPDGSYVIRMAFPSGEDAGPFMATLSGPGEWVYLTQDTIFRGTAHHGLGEDSRVLVPAAAMECPEGFKFLNSRRIAMPARVAGKVRLMKMVPTVACTVVDRAGYKPTREFHLKLEASAPDGPTTKFEQWEWRITRQATLPGDGKAQMLDNELMLGVSESLRDLGLKWDHGMKVMYRRWTKTYPDWLVNWLRSLPEGVNLDLDPETRSLLADAVSASLRIEMQEAQIDWFDIKVVMDVTDTTLTQEELGLLLKAGGSHVFLPRLGEWKRMKTAWSDEDGKRLARIGLSPADLNGEPHRVHVLQLADEAAVRVLPPEQAGKIKRRLDELRTRVTPPMPPAIRAELRPYQVEGFHFLAYLSENRFGGVLADDMGLGKTLQTLAWLAWLRAGKAGSDGPNCSLVVCPKSVMDNWRSEAERFFPGLRVVMWAPSAAQEFAAVRRDADLVVMNYAQLRLLDPAALQSPWFAAILDEAQGIKNPNSQTAQAARAIVATYRLALTGTPIENRLMDLWSIMAFAMPGALGTRTHFARRFAAQEDPLARNRLAARVRPFLIRRTKEEVAKDLPERTEEDIVCEMDGVQSTLYQAELKQAQQVLLGVKTQAEFNRERFVFLTSLLRLRQICCHPALVGQRRDTESAKLEALLDLVEPLMEEGHKVLVFSQFVQMLAIIQKQAEDRKWPHFLLTGDTEDRGSLVRSFQEHQGGAVFLLSLKAGGFGLNLTAANYVVLYDPWWNPAVERQAIDRTHRIGQTNPVNAYRLIAKNSIEQKIRLLQKKKSALADAVLGDERFGEALTLDDLKFILQD